MADQPTVTTPGGSDLFASLHSLDYDEAMALLVDENLSTASASSTGRTPTFSTGLTPGGAHNGNENANANTNGNAPFLMTPRTADFMAELAASSTPGHSNANANHLQQQSPSQATAMLFDHDLVSNGLGPNSARSLQPAVVKEESEDDVDDDGDALRPDDLPTPLNFSFTPTGSASVGTNGRYHIAAAHKHKRVRSNPDMLQTFNYQQLLGNTHTPPNMNMHNAPSPVRPSVGGGIADGVGGSASMPTTPLDGHALYEPLPGPLPIPIGTVNVATPVGFHVAGNGTGREDPLGSHQGGGDDTFPSDMDSFLKEMQWSEITENANANANVNANGMNVDTLSSLGVTGYRSQRIQAGVNELKMKRKRPTPQHLRHHSNPVDLLHNLDQFRLLSQQQQQQQQNESQQQQQLYTPPSSPPLSMQFPSPTKLEDMMLPLPVQRQHHQQMGMNIPMHPQQQLMAPQAFTMPPSTMAMSDMQFQVPTDIANGSARSLHARRASMPNAAFSRGGNGGRGGHHRRGASRGSGTGVGSTGLSMDMSQLNLEFLTLPEDEFQQQLQLQRQQHAFQHAMGGHGNGNGNGNGSGVFPSPPASPPLQNFQQQLTAAELETEKNRKSYKCGRCGKPKVGHVCTMPDLRNNWTQCDVDVTKGLKIVRTNCHIVATKTKWVPQHEDHVA